MQSPLLLLLEGPTRAEFDYPLRRRMIQNFIASLLAQLPSVTDLLFTLFSLTTNFTELSSIFASHYSALRSRSGVAPGGKGTGAWHSGKKRLSYTTA